MSRLNTKVWVVVACCGVIFWPGALTFGFPGVLSTTWQEMFGIGRGSAGNTLFFLLAAVGLFMFFVGKWQEKVGFKKMIFIGTIICGLAIFISAYANSIYHVYLWAFVSGAGTSFVYIPAVTIVQHRYPSRRGLVSGIVNVVFGLSAAIMSPLFNRMLASLGYVHMHFIISYLTLAIGIAACLLLDRTERIVAETEDAVAAVNAGSLLGKSLTLQETIRTRSFWFLWLVWALQGAAGIAMVTLSIAYGTSRGFLPAAAVVILTSFNVTNGLSRLASGYFSDIFGRTRIMSIVFLLSGIAYFLLPYSAALLTAALLASVVGFAFGTMFAVSAPLVSDCFGLKHFGAIFGLVFTAYGFLAGLLGPSLGGYLLDLTDGKFGVVFTYLGIFCLFSSIFIRFVQPVKD